MDEPILKVHELFVNYGKISALRDVSLTVHRGEIVALVGANGAGKSTLLQAISGLLKPRSGEIWFNGERIDGRQPNRILRAGIAHVPEGRRVFPRFDVRANLRMGGYSRSDFGDLGPEIEHILDEVPALRRRADSPAGSLSGGEQQLLAIHRALMGRPELLLLDEPTMGLAPVLVDGVLDLVAAMNRDGRTILLVEQNALAVLDIADRAYVLSAGSVVTEGAAADLLGRADFASSYLGL